MIPLLGGMSATRTKGCLFSEKIPACQQGGVGNPRRGFPTINPFPERVYLPSCAFFEKKDFAVCGRQRGVSPHTSPPLKRRAKLLLLHKLPFERIGKSFLHSKPTIYPAFHAAIYSAFHAAGLSSLYTAKGYCKRCNFNYFAKNENFFEKRLTKGKKEHIIVRTVRNIPV